MGTPKDQAAKPSGSRTRRVQAGTVNTTSTGNVSVQVPGTYKLYPSVQTTYGAAALVEYGITTEPSDVRIHVCPIAQHVYAYPTLSALEFMRTHSLIHKFTPRVIDNKRTCAGDGYLADPELLPDCVWTPIPQEILEAHPIQEHGTTKDLRVKNAVALTIVLEMAKQRILQLPPVARSRRDYSSAKDYPNLYLFPAGSLGNEQELRVHIFCDLRGGHENHGSPTGNLYLSRRENVALLPQGLRFRA